MTDLPVIIAVIGCALSIATFYWGRQSVTKTDAREMGTILAELQHIKNGVDEIKQRQEKYDEGNTRIIERIVAIESSCKSAHKRIDKLAGGGDGSA